MNFFKRGVAIAAAVEIVKGTTVTNQISGVGSSSNPISPYWCIQDDSGVMTYALPYGESVDANKYSGNAYYAGGALRFDGCGSDNTYLGYLGVSNTHSNLRPLRV